MQDKNKKNNTKYISLNKAAKKSGYAQDYLSLLCRQGKLRGEKIGRNWVTTRQWLDEYQKYLISDVCVVSAKKSLWRNRLVLTTSLFFLFLLLLGGFACAENFGRLAPEIFPKVAGASISVGYDEDEKISDKIISFSGLFADTISAARNRLAYRISETGENISSAGENIYSRISAGKLILEAPAKITNTFIFAGKSLADGFNNFSQEAAKPFGSLKKNICLAVSGARDRLSETGNNIFNGADNFSRSALAVLPSPKSEKEKEKLKEKIELSFSDEIKVKPEDENSGIITPVFRESQGDDYLYLMVPVEK